MSAEKTVLWTAADAADATGGRLAGPSAWTATGVTIDSRKVAPGDLFVAIRGPNYGLKLRLVCSSSCPAG